MSTGAESRDGWSKLFRTAFRQSRNPMVLLDAERVVVDVNGAFLRLLGVARDDVVGKPAARLVLAGPALTPEEWAAGLAVGHFTGATELLCANGGTVTVQWGADAEVVTGDYLVLLVALSTSQWGRHFRREPSPGHAVALSEREIDVVRLVAKGLTDREIGDELHISHETARTHVRNAMAKLDARSRAQLIANALAGGMTL